MWRISYTPKQSNNFSCNKEKYYELSLSIIKRQVSLIFHTSPHNSLALVPHLPLPAAEFCHIFLIKFPPSHKLFGLIAIRSSASRPRHNAALYAPSHSTRLPYTALLNLLTASIFFIVPGIFSVKYYSMQRHNLRAFILRLFEKFLQHPFLAVPGIFRANITGYFLPAF